MSRASKFSRRSVFSLTSLLGLIALGSWGCADLLGPHLPRGAVPLDPIPPEYASWWQMTEECSGRTGRLEDVRWFTVPGASTLPGSDHAAGFYQWLGHYVVLAGRFEREGHMVRHEMLHALAGARGHPRELFVERCGGVVSCGGACLQEVGETPTWDPSTPVVRPEEIQVSVDLLPRSIQAPTEIHGCPTLTVSLTNNTDRAVAVELRGGGSFRWAVEGWGEGAGGGLIPIDSLVILPPGESWPYGFDCPRLFRSGLPPGEYKLWGIFDNLRSPHVVIESLP